MSKKYMSLDNKFPGGLEVSNMVDTDYADGNTKWIRFADAQCPICGHRDWCLVNVTGTKVICMRTPSDDVKKVAGGYLYKLKDGEAVKFDPASLPKVETVPYANADMLDLVNRLVLMAYPLSKKHYQNLVHRGLNEQQIKLRDTRGFGSFYVNSKEAKEEGAKPFQQARMMPGKKPGKAIIVSHWEKIFAKLHLPKNSWKGVPGFFLNSVTSNGVLQFEEKTTGKVFKLEKGKYSFPEFHSPVNGMLVPYYDVYNRLVGFQTRVDHVMITPKNIKFDGFGTAKVYFKENSDHYTVKVCNKANRYGKVVYEGEVQSEKPVQISVGALKERLTFTPHFGGKYFWVSSSRKHLGAEGKTPIQVAYNPQIAQLKPGDHQLDEYISKPKTVWLTEGGLKGIIAADKLAENYAPADLKKWGQDVLAVAGVSSYRKFFPALEQLNIKRVVVAYDMDFQKNDQVEDHLKELLNGLHEKGYEVYLALWQHVKGLDDALNSKETIKFRNLFDAAQNKGLASGQVTPADLPTMKAIN